MGEQNQNFNATSTPHVWKRFGLPVASSGPALHCRAKAISPPSVVAREGEAGLPGWTHRRTAVLPVLGELLGCWPGDHHEASDFPSFHQPSLSLVRVMGLGIRTLRYADKAWLRPGSPISTRATGRILGPSPGGHAGFSNSWVKESKRSALCVCACI